MFTVLSCLDSHKAGLHVNDSLTSFSQTIILYFSVIEQPKQWAECVHSGTWCSSGYVVF